MPESSKACAYSCGAIPPVKHPAAQPHGVHFVVWAALSVPAKNWVFDVVVMASRNAARSFSNFKTGRQNKWYFNP
jgi:hypothetical protein